MKRDFNLAAKILLALSMFSVGVAIINGFSSISAQKHFIHHDNTLITEIVIDFCILAASVLTFMKKRYGLVALVTLFCIRTGNIPSGGKVPYEYLLGGKCAHLFSDFLPFAIAMFFRKNGISGWKAMLASEEYLASLNNPESYSSESIEKPLGVDGDTSVDTNDNNEYDAIENTTSGQAMAVSTDIGNETETPNAINESNDQFQPKIQQEDICSEITESHSYQEKTVSFYQRGLRFWLIVLLSVVVGFVSISLIVVASKSYPEFVTSFEEKCRYSFNFPNDTLAKTLMKEMYSSRDTSLFVLGKLGRTGHVMTSKSFYRQRFAIFNNWVSAGYGNVYVTTNLVTDTNEIVRSDYYAALDDSDRTFLYKGITVLDYWNFNKALGVTFRGIKPYKYEDEKKREMELVDNAASLRVTDFKIIRAIGSYYESEENFTKASDYYRSILHNMKRNIDVKARLAYSLMRNADTVEAVNIANEVLKRQPQNELALTALANIEADQQNWGDAMKYSKRAIDYDAKKSDVYFIYAQSLYIQGDKKDAREYYNKAYEMNRTSKLGEKYAECGGCPFEVLSFHYGLTDESGNEISQYDSRLYSAKSKYLDIKLNVKFLRWEDAEIGVKIFKEGILLSGEGSKNGFIYTQKVDGCEPGEASVFLLGWGSKYAGHWEKGTYDIEIWYKGGKIAEDTFRFY